MLSSGLFSCVRLRRSRLGVLSCAVLSSGRVCSGGQVGAGECMVRRVRLSRVQAGSGGQVGVSLVMLCYVSLRRSN